MKVWPCGWAVGFAALLYGCVTPPQNILMKPGWTVAQQRADLIACDPGRIDPGTTGPAKSASSLPTPPTLGGAAIGGLVSGYFSGLDAAFLHDVAVWECMNKKGYAPRYLSPAEQSALGALSSPQERLTFILSLEPRRMPEKPSVSEAR